MTKYLPYVRKAVAALMVCAIALVGAHMLPDSVGTALTVLTPVLVALGVYNVPANGPHPNDAADGDA